MLRKENSWRDPYINGDIFYYYYYLNGDRDIYEWSGFSAQKHLSLKKLIDFYLLETAEEWEINDYERKQLNCMYSNKSI